MPDDDMMARLTDVDVIEARAVQARDDMRELDRVTIEVGGEVADGLLHVDDSAVEICARLDARFGIVLEAPTYMDADFPFSTGRQRPPLLCTRCSTLVAGATAHSQWHLRLMAAVKLADVRASLAADTAFLLGALLAATLGTEDQPQEGDGEGEDEG